MPGYIDREYPVMAAKPPDSQPTIPQQTVLTAAGSFEKLFIFPGTPEFFYPFLDPVHSWIIVNSILNLWCA